MVLIQTINNIINSHEKRIIQTRRLYNIVVKKLGQLDFQKKGGYIGFYEALTTAEKNRIISPVKASGFNGRNPALYNKYRKLDKKENYYQLERELYLLSPKLKIDYYLKNIKQYKALRDRILELDKFLREADIKKLLNVRVTVNERSYQIFRDEKFLADSTGKRLLKNLGLDYESLNCYKTHEPFFYIFEKQSKGNSGLIVENKDTFSSIKKLFSSGKTRLNDVDFRLLIYGEGKKIINSFGFIEEIFDTVGKIDTFYYYGDIDYEGINIFLSLKEKYNEYRIIPTVLLYENMVHNSGYNFPILSSNQKYNRDITGFVKYFDKNTCEKMVELLNRGFYIPQEALSYKELAELFSR